MTTRLLTQSLLFFFLLLPALCPAQTEERFPKPDFQSGYTRPDLQTPPPRANTREIVDIAVLIAALSLASYLTLKVRSRRYVFVLMLFCMVYFGFYREGCVCSVGSVQNVAYALFNPGYAIPISVILFFALPLLFTLFFGRTFCAAVCPLGAIQDVVVLRPTRVPSWLSHSLSLLPHLYLGLAVLFAATGAGFIICQYDPFIGFYRFSASFHMVLLGLSLLLLGTVVARPYCRFLCPYGVLLDWMSRLSRHHVTITPDECSECRLCEASCPVDAIELPDDGEVAPDRPREVKRLAALIVLLPILVAGSGWLGSRLGEPLAGQNATVSLAREIRAENAGLRLETTEKTRTFRASGKQDSTLYHEEEVLQAQFTSGGWAFGIFMGLIIGVKLIQLTLRRRQTGYQIDRGLCLSCARCFKYCPYELVRRGTITLEEVPH
jgi:NosR/NirI family transcriptional regulator, nitrous oxide reductase regulator